MYLEVYQQMRPAPAKTGAWTEEEDILLLEYQAFYGNKWSQISQHIPGRNGQQVAQRWRHKVNPNIVKDKWTEEEDSLLTKLIQELGVGKWASVARHLPGRTDQQCMGRWRRHLDPSIRKDAWTAQEDAQLQALYAEHGSSWSLIAKAISNRTPQQCRGRWCILTSSRGKAPAQTASEAPTTSRASQDREAQDADVAAPVQAARHGRPKPQGCPSTAQRPEAVTELPAMPASATMPTPAGGDLTRVTRARARVKVAMATLTETPRCAVVSCRERRPRVLQDPGSAEALAAAERAKARAQSQEEEEEVVGQADAAEANSSGAPRGRLQLGTRLLSFRRRSRSTQRRPRTRLAALAVPAADETPSPAAKRGAKTEPTLQGAAATSTEMPPPPPPLTLPTRGASKGLQERCGDEKHAAAVDCKAAATCGCQAADSGGVAAAPASVPCEAGRAVGAHAVASTCERPTVSTSSRSGLGSLNGCSRQRPAGRTEAAPDDVRMDMCTRVTRSGRCYPLAATPAMTAAKQSCAEQSTQAVVRTEAAVEAPRTTASERADCGGDPLPSQEPLASAGPSLAVPGAMQHDAGAAPAAQLPGAPAREVVAPAVDFGAFEAHEPALDAGPAQDINLSQQATPAASANTSLGLPEGLFGGMAASPAGEQPLDWQDVVGSPPTSSFLAFVEAGFLQTPSAAHGPSAGPDLLCAPVPPGMPKVTPGFSNEWSDVPALSWTELQAGGFGLIGRPPTASAQGTPDNSRPVLRPVQGDDHAGITPRRDMYVRPAVPGLAHGPAPALAQCSSGRTLRTGAVEPAGEGEGQGDTRSLPPSPNTRAADINRQGAVATARGTGPDGALRGEDSYTTREAVTPDRRPQPHAAVASATHAAQRRLAVPDFCSPAKKQQAAHGRSAAGPGAGSQGCGSATANCSLPVPLQKLKTATRAPNGAALSALSNAPLLPPLAMLGGGASPHPSVVLQTSFARGAALPLPPALASVFLPAVAPQPPPPLGASTGVAQQRPTGLHLQMPPAPSFGAFLAPSGCTANGASGPFPRLALPKPPVAGTMRSLFPVLSLSGYQTGKENVTR